MSKEIRKYPTVIFTISTLLSFLTVPLVGFSASDKSNKDVLFQEYIKEYSGKIYKEGVNIYYSHKDRQIQIGVNDQICSGKFQKICDFAIGKKLPNDDNYINKTVYTVSLMIRSDKLIDPSEKRDTRFDILEYAISAPNQQGAGSCLFMATAGAIEILLNQSIAPELRVNMGDTDISERYLMNAKTPEGVVPNFLTDTVYKLNYHNGALLNRDYPFTKGWYKKIDSRVVIAEEGEEEASYGAYYNWIDEYSSNPDLSSLKIPVPNIERQIIYADPESNQWNVGLMNDDIIDEIKSKLREYNAPVLLVYNHFLYWHATLIVGYDDEVDTEGCPFVDSWQEYLTKRAQEHMDNGEEAKARSIKKSVSIVKKARETQGGCTSKGVFYVRDSIYKGEEGDLVYDYDLASSGDEAPYSKRIVKHSYNWAKYLGNHAYVIHF